MENLHPGLIRVWFDTVLNPIIDGLRVEIYYLGNQNWTWRHFNNFLEYIKPLRKYISIRNYPNLEQFEGFYPNLTSYIDKHDKLYNQLLKCCDELQFRIIESKDFKDFLKRIIRELKQDKGIDKELIENVENKESNNWFAEYMVNKLYELDSSYLLSLPWNRYRVKFLDLLTSSSCKLYNDQVTSVGKDFNIFNEKVNKDLKKLRNDLSLKYGVPIVLPITDTVTTY